MKSPEEKTKAYLIYDYQLFSKACDVILIKQVWATYWS